MSTCNVEQAAALLHVHPKTLLDLISTGVLPAAKIGRAWVLLERDVLSYLAQEIARQTAERLGPAPRQKRQRRRARGG